MAQQWYYSKNDQQIGPVSAKELRQLSEQGKLLPTDLVWLEGTEDWKLASTIKELTFSPSAPPPLPKSTSAGGSGSYCRSCGKAVNPQGVVCLSCGIPPLEGNSFCNSCCRETALQAVVCVGCGVGLQRPSKKRQATRTRAIGTESAIIYLTPPMAAFLSVLLVGLGQFLMGQKIKGIAMLVAAVIFGSLTLGGALIVFWPVSAIDAYCIAKKIENGQDVGEWEFF